MIHYPPGKILTGTPDQSVTSIGASFTKINEIELPAGSYIILANVAIASSVNGSIGVQVRNQSDNVALCQARATAEAGGGVVAAAILSLTGTKTIIVRAAQNSGASAGIGINTLTAIGLTPGVSYG